MKRLLLLSALLCLVRPLLADEGAATGRIFRVELKVVSVPEGTLGSSNFTVTAHALTVSSNGQWSMAGQVSDAGALLEKLGREPVPAEVLSAPIIVVRGGQEAQVRIEQELAYLAPETGVLYRVHRSWLPGRAPRVEEVRSGLYRMQVLDEKLNPGVAVTLTPTPMPGGAIAVDLAFRYNLLVNQPGRIGPGALLEQPQIDSRQITTRVLVQPGQWAMPGGMPQLERAQDRARESIVIFLRVNEVPASTAP